VTISLEQIQCPAYLLRVHLPAEGYGDPYSFVCVVEIAEDEHQAHIKGAAGNITTAAWREIRKKLLAIGATTVIYERRNGEALRFRTVDLPTGAQEFFSLERVGKPGD
jgi:hypothetical protein